MPTYTATVTLLAIAFYFFLATRVAVARGRYNVKCANLHTKGRR